jgi:radical SAM protein with 4Fe4S-binding SPASM domain
MRYLSNAGGLQEALQIGVATGTMPPTYLQPQIDQTSVLRLEPTSFLPMGELTLVLAEHTASWALLSVREAEVARMLTGRSFAELSELLGSSDDDRTGLEFLTALYRRGLLRVDGRPGLDPSLLAEGALFRDAYLVEVLVTQKCNLACQYCLAEAGPDMQHLHPELAHDAIDAAFSLPRSRPLTIQLSGGEPFLNFRLFADLVEHIERNRDETGREVRVVTQSNGTLINDAIATFVREHHIDIGVSCDGPSSLNDLSRPTVGGRPSHARTLRGMEALRRNGVRFGVITVLSRANVAHVDELVDFYVEQGISGVKINPVNTVGDARAAWDVTGISSDEYYEFVEKLIDHLIDADVPLAEANLREYLQYLTKRIHDYRCMRSNCGAGKSFFLIDSQGDVYPCAHSAGISQWRMGSVSDAGEGLPALGSRTPVLLDFPRRLVDQMPETSRCPWRHFCEGGCAVNAYQEKGSILAPDTLCAFYERLYPRLFERLAVEPQRFQRLLDITLGPGAATVIDEDFRGLTRSSEKAGVSGFFD